VNYIWNINDTVVFTCNTHNPNSGAAQDADSNPIYRIYENETQTAIASGVMSKLDDAFTTGLYAESIQLLEGNGYEKNKTYTIYIEATVAGVTGSMSHAVQIVDVGQRVWSYSPRSITQSVASTVVPSAAGAISIIRGDTTSISLTGLGDLTAAEKLDFTVKRHNSDSDSNAVLRIHLTVPAVPLEDGLITLLGSAYDYPADGEIAIDDAIAGNITITIQARATADLPLVSNLYYDIQTIESSGSVRTHTIGLFSIVGDITRSYQ
jgi:hypothetical protein